MDCSDRPILLNTLFFFRFANHAIGINAITLAHRLRQRLQIDAVSVGLDNILSHGKALHGTDEQTRPFGNVKFGVARHINHHGTNNSANIGDEFAQCAPHTS